MYLHSKENQINYQGEQKWYKLSKENTHKGDNQNISLWTRQAVVSLMPTEWKWRCQFRKRCGPASNSLLIVCPWRLISSLAAVSPVFFEDVLSVLSDKEQFMAVTWPMLWNFKRKLKSVWDSKQGLDLSLCFPKNSTVLSKLASAFHSVLQLQSHLTIVLS